MRLNDAPSIAHPVACSPHCRAHLFVILAFTGASGFISSVYHNDSGDLFLHVFDQRTYQRSC